MTRPKTYPKSVIPLLEYSSWSTMKTYVCGKACDEQCPFFDVHQGREGYWWGKCLRGLELHPPFPKPEKLFDSLAEEVAAVKAQPSASKTGKKSAIFNALQPRDIILKIPGIPKIMVTGFEIKLQAGNLMTVQAEGIVPPHQIGRVDYSKLSQIPGSGPKWQVGMNAKKKTGKKKS